MILFTHFSSDIVDYDDKIQFDGEESCFNKTTRSLDEEEEYNSANEFLIKFHKKQPEMMWLSRTTQDRTLFTIHEEDDGNDRGRIDDDPSRNFQSRNSTCHPLVRRKPAHMNLFSILLNEDEEGRTDRSSTDSQVRKNSKQFKMCLSRKTGHEQNNLSFLHPYHWGHFVGDSFSTNKRRTKRFPSRSNYVNMFGGIH